MNWIDNLERVSPEQWKYITDLASIPFSLHFLVVIAVMVACWPRTYADRWALVREITFLAVASRYTISAVFDLQLNTTPWAAVFFIIATIIGLIFAGVVAIRWGGIAVHSWIKHRRHEE